MPKWYVVSLNLLIIGAIITFLVMITVLPILLLL